MARIEGEFDHRMATKQPKVHTFEQAVELTGSGRFQLVLLFATGTSLLSVIIEGMNMAVVLPAAKCEIAISTVEQGVINAVAFIGVVLTSHFWGFMADTWGRRRVLQCALGTGFLFSALSSISTSSVMLLVTRFCVGLCISGVQAASISYLGEFHSNRTRSKAVTFAAMFMTMAVIYQSLMGLFIMPRSWEFSLFGWLTFRSWRIYIVITSLTSALAWIIIFFLPESPKFLLSMERPDECLEVLRLAYAANGLGRREDFPVQKISLLETSGLSVGDIKGIGAVFRMVWKQTRPLLHKDHIGHVLLMCTLTFLLFLVSHGSYMWYPQLLTLYYPFMNDAHVTTCAACMRRYYNRDMAAAQAAAVSSNSSSTNTTGGIATLLHKPATCNVATDSMTYYIILVTGCAFLLLYVVVALIGNRYGMRTLLTSWLVVTGLCALALLWTDSFYLNLVLFGGMLSSGNCGGILSALAADLFPTHFKGTALCFVMMFGRIGAVAGSNIFGALIKYNCDVIFILYTCLLAVACCICYYVLHKRNVLMRNNK